MTFGERLYKLRNEKNISQEELAELLDVSRQSISKWENNKAYPEMTRLLFLSDYFQISLDDLMRGTGEEKRVINSNSTASETKDAMPDQEMTIQQEALMQQETSGSENTADKSDLKYQVKSMVMLWNDFVTNLSERQRKKLMLLYVLLVCVLVCVIAHFVYGGGYAIGQFIRNLQNDLNI